MAKAPTPNHPPLAFTTPNSTGYVPDLAMRGRGYKHTETGMIMQIKGFEFDAERERWVIRYKEADMASLVAFVHLPEDFFRDVGNGRKRFEPL